MQYYYYILCRRVIVFVLEDRPIDSQGRNDTTRTHAEHGLQSRTVGS